MRAAEVLASLEAEGIRFILTETSFRLKGKGVVLSDDRKALLRLHQKAITALLRERQEAQPPQKPKPSRDWNEVEMAWAEGLEPAYLPPVPFSLRPGIRVMGAEKFLAKLQEAIAQGPDGPRARTGALQEDVRNLKTLMEQQP